MKHIKFYFSILSMALLSNCIGTDIVEDVAVIETVSINNAIDSLKIGDTYTFSADYFNGLGKVEANKAACISVSCEARLPK